MRLLKEHAFCEEHLDELDPNEFSDFEQYRGIITLPNTLKFTLKFEEKVVCVLLCYPYSLGKYMGFLLASADLSGQQGADIREFVKDRFLAYSMSRLETTSVACEKIDRWHEFLGFELEGTKRRYIGDKDYNMWGLVSWE